MSRPFDKAKYRALSEGLEISEAEIDALERTFRVDSEYFLNRFQEIQSRLANHITNTIADVASISDGNHFSISEDFVKDGLPYYRGQDVVGNFFIEQAAPVLISESSFERPYMRRSHLRKGDVLLSIVGTIGELGIVTQKRPSTCSCKLAILRPKAEVIQPEYLAIFLKSRYGYGQTERLSRGAIQRSLLLEDMDQILIPRFSFALESKIGEVVRSSHAMLNNGVDMIRTAECCLLSALGLESWQPQKKAYAEKSFEEFRKLGRLDAEYFQPKYDELKAIVNRHAKDIRTISEIQTFNARGLQPDYDPEGTLDVINSKHILENGLDYGNFEKALASDWTTRGRARVHRDDILIYTTGANIGRSAIYLSDAQALASNHVNILRLDARNKIYVAFVLNSIVGRMQTEQISTGSAQQELYPKDIDQFYMPFISDSEQDAISEKVLECYALRAESKRLLEVAKLAVETAIEQGEEAAMSLLEGGKTFA